MDKNSFTLFETIISVSILSLVISGFYFSTYSKNKKEENFQLLNSLENIFDTKNYQVLELSNENIKLIKNENETINLNVKKYTYEDEQIKIFKYEK